MKTITIEKGKEAFYSSLSADTLVVNGVLKVNGALKVRRLLGRDLVDARRLEADTVNLRTGFIREVEISSGAFGELYATTCKAKGTLCAKNFVQALEVSAKRLVMNRSNIGSCTAQEVVSLRRYLPDRLLSGIKKLLSAPFRKLTKPKKKAAQKPVLSLPKEPVPKPEPDSELVSAILESLREKGYTISPSRRRLRPGFTGWPSAAISAPGSATSRSMPCSSIRPTSRCWGKTARPDGMKSGSW